MKGCLLDKLAAYGLYYETNRDWQHRPNTDCFDIELTERMENYERALKAHDEAIMDGISYEADASLLLVFALRAHLSECFGWVDSALSRDYETKKYDYFFLDDEVAKRMKRHFDVKYRKVLEDLDEKYGWNIGWEHQGFAGQSLKVFCFGFGRNFHFGNRIVYPMPAFDDRVRALRRFGPTLWFSGDMFEFPEEANENFHTLLRDPSLAFTHMRGIDIKDRIPMDWYERVSYSEWDESYGSFTAKHGFLNDTFGDEERWYKGFLGIKDEPDEYAVRIEDDEDDDEDDGDSDSEEDLLSLLGLE